MGLDPAVGNVIAGLFNRIYRVSSFEGGKPNSALVEALEVHNTTRSSP
jgi:hypothetical protein